jgi:hypothetical protein
LNYHSAEAVAVTAVDLVSTEDTETRVAAETVAVDMVETAVAVDTAEIAADQATVEIAVVQAMVEDQATAETLALAQTTAAAMAVDTKVDLIAVPDSVTIVADSKLVQISLLHPAKVAQAIGPLVVIKVLMQVDLVEMAIATIPVGVVQAVALRNQISTKIIK